jgi:hypothetical protein
MVSSGGGGGNSRAPSQPIPAGASVPYGATSAPAAWPASSSVLPSTGSPMTMDLMSSAWQDPSWSTPVGPAAAPAGGGLSDMDAFAQQLLDYNKQKQFASNLMTFGPTRGYGISQMFGSNAPQAPVAQGPTQQLLASLAGRNQLASAMAGNGRSMASYRR